MNTRDKVIFISGANRGIGKALVEAALEGGAKKTYAAARKIESLPKWDDPRVVAISMDVTDARSVETAAKLAKDTEVLINNAGILTFGGFLSASASDLHKDMDTNFYGTLQVIRAFVPWLREKPEAAIANLLSVVALASMSGIGGYSASKAALFSATQALRVELKSKKISVHGVFPGPIDTDMAKGFELPKTSPEVTARNILAGIHEGVEDIFPDGMSKEIGSQWLKDPKAVERSFAAM